MPERNGHTGYLAWTLDLPVVFTVACKVCPGHTSDQPFVVDEWQPVKATPTNRPDLVWKRHCSTPPPDRLPTMAQLTTGGTT